MRKYDEVINFRDFVKNDYKKTTKKQFEFATLSLAFPALFITPSGLFSPPPMIVTGYMIVLGVGGVLITAAFAEKFFAEKENTSLASGIVSTVNFILPIIFVGALVYFISTNPLLNW